MTHEARTRTRVLIIGAGPAGLAMAIELGHRGIPCVLVERNARTGFAPRAKTTNVRTREHLRRWGIADAVQAKLVVPPPGTPVGALVARGEVALGFQQLSELMDLPGIDVLGPLPDAVQITTVFSGGVAATSRQPDAVRALLAFLASAPTAPAKLACGMAPL